MIIQLIMTTIFLLGSQPSAGETVSVTPVPKDPQFRSDVTLSLNVLKALLYENVRLYLHSGREWKKLAESSIQAQDHAFFADLFSYLEFQSEEVPETAASLLLLSRYLSWQRKWQQAYEVIQQQTATSATLDTHLETIRLCLILGYYDQAEKIMTTVLTGFVEHRDRMQLEIYKVWMYILQGKTADAFTSIHKLEEDYLYLPASSMFPMSFLGNTSEDIDLLEQSLVRFPSNQVIFEQLVMILLKHNEWQKLDELVLSQRYLNGVTIDWYLQAEIYLNTGQADKLAGLSQATALQSISPEYFDILARAAIKRKDWPALLQISKALQKNFPQILDGKLYQVIYLEETGQIAESRKLLEQARM